MKNNKKGFTLIELLSVLILLVVIITIATLNLIPSFDKGKKSSIVDEAFVFEQGVMNKYNDDRLNKTYASDLFSSKNSNKRCYSLKSLIGPYVSKDDKKYFGSMEVCTGESCTYKTKAWISDGDYYLNGVIVDDTLTVNDIQIDINPSNFETCGVDVSNIENEWFFDYQGYTENFIVPEDGTYSIESWGASGGNAFYMVRDGFGFGSHPVYIYGGKGGYAYTEIDLKKGDSLYITVGGEGPFMTYDRNLVIDGGFNGGGKANYHAGGGGGASHVAFKPGSIDSLKISDIIEVAGGGGSAFGAGGEYYQGSDGTSGGGNCDSGNSVCFGSGVYGVSNGLGGGGGLYTSGGGPTSYPFYPYSWGGVTYYYTNTDIRRARYGGSGYVGNPLTKNGIMYTYGGSTNMSDFQKSLPTGVYSEEPLPQYAKKGDGFVKITHLNISSFVKDFNYTGSYHEFVTPKTGNYRFEVWGAQGGSGGTGGYSSGEIQLTEGEKFYVYVGGVGGINIFSARGAAGGFNGGGSSPNDSSNDAGAGGGGGGATHIATRNGLLRELGGYRDSVIIVAGGGGGATGNTQDYHGGHGGGFKGNNGVNYSGNNDITVGGTQTTGYAFGQGSSPTANCHAGLAGAGGGWYGGYVNPTVCDGSSGSGGSGYIGNPRLTNKVMYCNSCAVSNDEDTRTVSTYCVDSLPRSSCAKYGSGYARITLLDEI